MDKYELKQSKNGTLFYYKNGLLHRENGPAIVELYDIQVFSNLDDKNLYPSTPSKLKKEDNPPCDEYYLTQGSQVYYTSYYLNNKNYTKEEFEKISAVLKNKSELDLELPQIGVKLNKIKL